MKRWKIGLNVLLVLVIALVITNSLYSADLTIGYFSKAIGYAPYYVAKYHGWFEKDPALTGWTIKHVEYGDRPTISQAFDKGDLQFLLSADIPAIMCRAQGNDIRIVTMSGLVTLQWLVRSDLPVKSLVELKGKKVAFQSGTSSHYGFLTTTVKAGLSKDDLNIKHDTCRGKNRFRNRST